MLQNSEEDSDLIRLVKELQASLMKNDLLLKENQELHEEIRRLKTQVINLKSHENERKSMLWKKLQSNTDESNLKDSQSFIKSNEKIQLQQANSNSNAMKLQPQPPPPPPLPSQTKLGKRCVKRVPEVIELYRTLTRRESHVGMNQKGVLLFGFNKNMIGEIENRSKYLSDIKSDIERHKDHINSLINKVVIAKFTEISEVEAFVKWIDKELSSLVDERAVLKHFPKWPERKADSLREAACNYKSLKNLESEILTFKNNQKESLTQTLQRIQSLQDRVEESVKNIEKIREGTRKRYKDYEIPWEWMLDTGFIGHIKYTSLKLAQHYINRIIEEMESKERNLKEGNLMLQGVRFAYTLHQFVGGFDEETRSIFNELKKMNTS